MALQMQAVSQSYAEEMHKVARRVCRFSMWKLRAGYIRNCNVMQEVQNCKSKMKSLVLPIIHLYPNGTLNPGIGLIVWQLVMLTALVLFLLSWILIFKDTKIGRTKKVVWLLVTLMLPVVGPVVFLVSAKKLSSE
jgi:hypothetical protein